MIHEPSKIETNNFEYTSTLSELSLITNDNINIAIYQRGFSKNIETYLNRLLSKGFSPINVSINVNELDVIFDDHFKSLNEESNEGYVFLKNDVKRLLTQFSKICNSPNLKIFFGIVDTDMCRRFHTDMYELRMLCTYKGQGTMWLTDDNINYKALNNYEGNEEIVLNTDDIKQLNSADIAILKGALYPYSKIGGVVHRSPTIENLNQKRIVLRVDNNSLLDKI